MPTIIDGTTGVDQIQDGTVTEAKIADGAVTAAKLAAGVISTTSVLAATAGATAGAVGTYAWAATINNNTRTAFGATLAGSSLQTQGINGIVGGTASRPVGADTTTLSGTWRCMGTKPNFEGFSSDPNSRNMTLWLRIS
jgi:hypothetical protein